MKINKYKKYLAFSKGTILEGFTYKFSALGWLLGSFYSVLILFFLWTAIFNNSTSEVINGFTKDQMIFYVIYSTITSTIVFSSSAFWNVGMDIYEGLIAYSIIRPMSYRFKTLAQSFGNFIATAILMFIPLMIISYFGFQLILGYQLITIPNLIYFLISIMLGFVLVDGLNFLIGEIAIFTNALFGLMIVKNIIFSFLSGALLPSSFFPKWLSDILTFLPFQGIVEKPLYILMGRFNFLEVLNIFLNQIFWIIILELLCKFTFSRIRKHIVSVGG